VVVWGNQSPVMHGIRLITASRIQSTGVILDMVVVPGPFSFVPFTTAG